MPDTQVYRRPPKNCKWPYSHYIAQELGVSTTHLCGCLSKTREDRMNISAVYYRRRREIEAQTKRGQK